MKRSRMMFIKIALVVMSLMVVMLGCTNGNTGDKPVNTDPGTKSPAAVGTPEPVPSKPLEPVTITMMHISNGGISDLVFAPMKEAVEKTYPHITLELNTGNVNEAVIAGMTPDIVFSGILNVGKMVDLGLAVDLIPLAEKYNIDLTRYVPGTVEAVRAYGKSGELYALPWSLTIPVMYYNKEIFDHFAQPYPTDGMTWDEVIALARNLHRQQDGVQYIGLQFSDFARTATSMLLLKNDKDDRALLTTEPWKRALETFVQLSQVGDTSGMKFFRDERRVAMRIALSTALQTLEDGEKSGNGFEWDVVTVPTFPDQRMQVESPMQVVGVVPTTKHEEDAFRVIEVIMSDETQRATGAAGRLSALADNSVRKAFLDDMISVKGKNFDPLFTYEHQPVNYIMYDDIIDPLLNNAAKKVLKGEMDVNSALREAEEAANKEIQALGK